MAALAAELDLLDEAWPARGFRGFLGAVQLVDVHPAAGCCAPWGNSDGRWFHWILQRPQRYGAPIAGGGKRGLFWTPDLAQAPIAP
ncbi:hypothetical protein PV458_36580 [Streptomyces sp. MN03-5084-2B]|nr:hypothetical protein [Streptomyces sp. MN03-5084-2B]